MTAPARFLARLRRQGVTDERVLAAMAVVPRELFVPAKLRASAYDDAALPIGCGATISQPAMVARICEELRLDGDERVLDVGTGSGYQAAVLAKLVHAVRGVEIRRELAELARRNLDALGLEHVPVRVGDGGYGWAEHAPYDAILVAAAAREVPVPLAAQLADGGRLVIPLGDPGGQELVRLIRRGDSFTRASFGPVRFVAFMGDYGDRLAPSGN